MVGFQDILNFNADQWMTASKNWGMEADHQGAAAHDLHANGIDPVGYYWHSPVVDSLVLPALTKAAGQFDCANDEMYAVHDVLEGFAVAVGAAKSTAQKAWDLAVAYGYSIDPDGTVHDPPQSNASDPQRSTVSGVTDPGGDVRTLVHQAMTQARQADQDTANQLRYLAGRTSVSDMDEADKDLNKYSAAEVSEIQSQIPTGQKPEVVAQWWSGLSPKQQEQLKLAAPLQVANLNGIPQNVKDDIRGDDKFDRVKALQFAHDNATNASIDVPNANNCTHFTSQVLEAGGMHHTDEWEPSTGTATKVYDKLTGHGTADSAYVNAGRQKAFLLNNGGDQVPVSQAKPGDIIYWGNGPHASGDANETHHAAVVTAVMPDGDIRYTQHTGNVENQSFNGREDTINNTSGAQKVYVVRTHGN